MDGNPSKIDSSFINRNPSQNFDLNAQTSNQDNVFIGSTNQFLPESISQNQPQSNIQYQPALANQYQPASANQYQPQTNNQYQPAPINQYQPQKNNQYQPAPTNQYQPQTNNQYQPASANQYQPQTNNQYQPALTNQYQSELNNHHQPGLTNQYQPQSNNQYQPESSNPYQPQFTEQNQPQPYPNQYQPQFTNQYQPQPNNPLPGTQFNVKGQESNIDNYSQNIGSDRTIDYGLKTRESKPLYGSNFVVNGYRQSNTEVKPQQFRPSEQNLQGGQVFRPQLPSKPEQVNSDTNYPGTTQLQYPVRQNLPPKVGPINSNVNQNPIKSNPNGYINPGQISSPDFDDQSDIEGSQFLPNQNNYEAPTSYDNVQETQNTFLTDQKKNNQQRIKIPFAQLGNQKIVSSSSSTFNPNAWMREQLKVRQKSHQNTYPNEELEYEEFQPPNNQFNKPISTSDLGNRQPPNHQFNKPVSTFDLNNRQPTNNQFNKPSSTFDLGSNRQEIEYNKQISVQNSYGSSSDLSKSQINYGQPSLSNGYNSNPTLSNSALSKFNQYEQPQNLYPISQDRQTYGDSKMNKQFKIVVPNISQPIDITEQSTLPSSYLSNTKQSKELNFNRGSSSDISLNNYSVKYSNQNENVGTIQKPNYVDNSQSPSQDSLVYSRPANFPKCPNDFNGIKPHPTDCSKFLSCANGRTFEMNCGPGTLFNPSTSVCDHPYNVECDRPILTTTLPNTPEEDYISPIDLRQEFDHVPSNSEIVTESIPVEEHNQAVLETLPTENQPLKVLRNPTSIDLPDNFLPNSSIINTPTKVINNKEKNNVLVKIDLKPNSTQTIRLRGGPKNSEGFLQIQEKPFQWGVVCDEPNTWTIEKADIVCKQLGFKRCVISIHFIIN